MMLGTSQEGLHHGSDSKDQKRGRNHGRRRAFHGIAVTVRGAGDHLSHSATERPEGTQEALIQLPVADSNHSVKLEKVKED